jgi:hypothetical protein
MNNKKLILSLIKDDLINLKLVSGLLDQIDLNAENNFLHLSKTIFHLMGFEVSKQNEKLYQSYLKLIKKVILLDISDSRKPLDDLALEIYRELSAINSLN